MKTSILLILMLSLMPFSLAEEIKVTKPPTKWLPIYGATTKHTKVFFDSNSVEVIEDGKDKVVSKAILIVSSGNVEVEIDGKFVEVRSVVKLMMVECNSKIMVPLVDYYFTVPMPTREDIPIGVLKYTIKPESAERLEKSSIKYTSFCPEYI